MKSPLPDPTTGPNYYWNINSLSNTFMYTNSGDNPNYRGGFIDYKASEQQGGVY